MRNHLLAVAGAVCILISGCGAERLPVSEETMRVKDRYTIVAQRVREAKDSFTKPDQMVQINKIVSLFNELKLETRNQDFVGGGELSQKSIIVMDSKMDEIEKELATLKK